jgi:hypothetical protein
VPWIDIANYFQGKSPAECRYHYTRHLMLNSSDSEIKQEKWTLVKDCLLVQLVQEFGVKNWKQVSRALNKIIPEIDSEGRMRLESEYSCRERYVGILDKDIDLNVAREKFTEAECQLLLEKAEDYKSEKSGFKWT